MSVDGARHSVSFGEAPAWPLVAFTVQLVAGIRRAMADGAYMGFKRDARALLRWSVGSCGFCRLTQTRYHIERKRGKLKERISDSNVCFLEKGEK